MTANRPSSGWYPDPRSSGAERYWDGSVWTAYARPSGSNAVPDGMPVPQPAPAPAPPKKPMLGCFGLTVAVLAVVIGIVLVVQIAGSANRSSDSNATSDQSSEPALRATYFVEGTATSASITASRVSGTEQNTVMIPMRNSDGELGLAHTSEPGASLYIAAQNRGETGAVTCRIELDGVVVSENTSSGGYTIATCSYGVPY
ncbi:DUF2510 domain-containing protein [Cryobacterium sp. Y11]|uniref:DUF2510 domain-containing protein n=1 Tax=Cryobacterium sp. Y11 TaxID=2045016 RepID=UPI000CE3A024|nr:DUF2510 domain-containing protein [Cryobacterium sp. Y11]